MKVNHISIAVENLDKSKETFEKLLGISAEVVKFKERKLKIAIFHLDNLMIELISPMEGEQIVSKFLKKRGEGLHHIALEVSDAQSMYNNLKEKGFEIVQDIRRGVKSPKVFFLNPKTTNRVLIEIVEKKLMF